MSNATTERYRRVQVGRICPQGRSQDRGAFTSGRHRNRVARFACVGLPHMRIAASETSRPRVTQTLGETEFLGPDAADLNRAIALSVHLTIRVFDRTITTDGRR